MWLSSIAMQHPLFASRPRWQDADWQHRRVMSLFPQVDGPARDELGVLFRVEPGVGTGRVLVQSRVQPLSQFELRSVPLDQLLERMEDGAEVRLRLRVNAIRTVNLKSAGRTQQHRVPVRGAALDGWVRSRLEQCGLSNLDDVSCDVQVAHFKETPLHTVLVDASAVVADVGLLRAAVEDGLGRAKAYGCGLLSVVPVSNMALSRVGR